MTSKLLILIAAAAFEVSGDALMRLGMNGARAWLLAGAIVLAAYGIIVNRGGVDFGRLMGAYIVVFFVVSQAISAAIFGQAPSRSTIAGGVLVVAGGIVMLV